MTKETLSERCYKTVHFVYYLPLLLILMTKISAVIIAKYMGV